MLEISKNFSGLNFCEWPINYDLVGINFGERPKNSRKFLLAKLSAFKVIYKAQCWIFILTKQSIPKRPNDVHSIWTYTVTLHFDNRCSLDKTSKKVQWLGASSCACANLIIIRNRINISTVFKFSTQNNPWVAGRIRLKKLSRRFGIKPLDLVTLSFPKQQLILPKKLHRTCSTWPLSYRRTIPL